MLVEVKPIDVKKWHNKKGAESFTRPKKIQALVNADTMQYATGLTREEIKKFSEELKQDLSPQYDPAKPHPFWDSPMATIKLENNTMFFNTDLTLDMIKVKVMKASKYVANSQKEYEDGLYPEATHLIQDKQEEAEIKASKVAIKNQAVIEASKLSRGKKAEIIMILDNKNMKGQSDNFITVAMDELIGKDPAEVLRHIKMDAKEIANHALVLEALQKNVLQKEGHKISYHDSVIGTDVYDIVQYLGDDKNQDLRLRLINAVND